MSSVDLLKALAMVGIAGKYIFAVKGLKNRCQMCGKRTGVRGVSPEEGCRGDESYNEPFLSLG